MANLRIKIEREKDGSPDEKGYRSFEDIYEQVVDEKDVSVKDIVNAVNGVWPRGSCCV